MEDVRSKARICSCLDHASVSSVTPEVGNIIDTRDYEAIDLCFNLDITTGTATLAVYESDDSGMSGEAEVDSDFIIASEDGMTTDGATGTQVLHVGYVGHKRYIRPVVTGSDTPVYNIAGVAYKTKPKSAPTL